MRFTMLFWLLPLLRHQWYLFRLEQMFEDFVPSQALCSLIL